MIGESFKQQCPTCEAMVSVKNLGMVGKKMECPKCKDTFVVAKPVKKKTEDDEDDDVPAPPVKSKAAAPAKNGSAKPRAESYDVDDEPARPAAKVAARPKAQAPDLEDDDDDDERPSRPVNRLPGKTRTRDLDEDEDDEDEAPRKPLKKPAARDEDDEDDDEDEAPKKPLKKPVARDDDDEDDDEDEAPKKPLKKPAARDDDDEDDEEDEAPKKPLKKPVARDDDDEDDEEDEAPRKPLKKPAARDDDDEDDKEDDAPKKPLKKAAARDDDDDEDDEEDEAPKKPLKKAAAKHEDDEDEDEAPRKSPKRPALKKKQDDDDAEDVGKKPKKKFNLSLNLAKVKELSLKLKELAFKSRKNMISAGLAAFGILVLLVAGVYMVMSGSGSRNNQKPVVKTKPGGDSEKPPTKSGGNNTNSSVPSKHVPTQKDDYTPPNFEDLLPADSEQVARIFVPQLLDTAGLFYKAAFTAFEKNGPFQLADMDRRLGFAVFNNVEDIFLAERFERQAEPGQKSEPGWCFSIVHVKENFNIKSLTGALSLKEVKGKALPVAKNGKEDPKKGNPKAKAVKLDIYEVNSPWLEQLGRLVPGVSPAQRLLLPKRFDDKDKRTRPLYLHLYDQRTMILADEEPMMSFLQAKLRNATARTKEDQPKLNPSLKSALTLITRSRDERDKVLFVTATLMDKAEIKAPDDGRVIRYRPRPIWDIVTLMNERTSRMTALATTVVRSETAYKYKAILTCSNIREAKELAKKLEEKEPRIGAAVRLQKMLKDYLGIKVELGRDESNSEDSRIQVYPNDRNDKAIEVLLNLNLAEGSHSFHTAQNFLSLLLMDARAELTFREEKDLPHQLAGAAKAISGENARWRLKHGEFTGEFPPAAFPRRDKASPPILDPGERISWMASLLPYLGHEGLYKQIHWDAAWHKDVNWPVGRTLVPEFIDPSYPESARYLDYPDFPVSFGATHFVGIAGVGLDAADPTVRPYKRGIFGYDHSLSLKELENKGHGLSNTIMMMRVPYDDLGGVTPWMAGGGSTVRGVPERQPGRPWTEGDSIKPFVGKGQNGTIAVFADGSVRFITSKISDSVLQALCTVEEKAPILAEDDPDARIIRPLAKKEAPQKKGSKK